MPWGTCSHTATDQAKELEQQQHNPSRIYSSAPKSTWDLRKRAVGSRAEQDLLLMGFSMCDADGMRQQLGLDLRRVLSNPNHVHG